MDLHLPSAIAGLRTVKLTIDWEVELQRFFENNSAYFIRVMGESAAPLAANAVILGGPPAGWRFRNRWLIGYVDSGGKRVAMTDVVEGLLVAPVWHIGLFIVDVSRHGSGDAQSLLAGLEAWAIRNGAKWLRLGVVVGNSRAERFWEARGFREARIREGVEMGKRTQPIRIMFKPLAGGTPDEYFLLVDRDRPHAP